MDCREFREYHSELLDGILEQQLQDGANLHIAICASCAKHDASVRRALLVFRNLPPIEPSRHFSRRLNRRLALARRGSSTEGRFLPAMMGAVAVASAVLVAVVVSSNNGAVARATASNATATTTLTQQAMSELVTPAIAASMSAGFPVWPSLIMLERAQQQLTNAEFQFTTYTAPR